MAQKNSPFYFTKQDPDYSIKGSRDPLGFQVLWQHQGRKLIPYLSTVSMNLHDFQILCLAYFCYGKEPDNSFVRYFLRFEQLMAYVRYDPSKNTGFNGIESIRRKLRDTDRVSISNTTGDEILSNQRAYGIWGKYNMPFQDIDFVAKAEFYDIFKSKIDHLPESAALFTTPLGALAIGLVTDLATPKLGEDVAYAIVDKQNKDLFLSGLQYRG